MKQVLLYVAFILFLSLPSLLRAQTVSPLGEALTSAAADYISDRPAVPEKIKNMKLLKQVGSGRKVSQTEVDKDGTDD